ncbi:MAG: SOS response-associated peptidase [Pseudomonadota bacterium]
MCGRFYLTSTPAGVSGHFGVDVRDNFPPRYNVAPTQPIAVIRHNDRREAEYALVRWGFIPEWAKGDYLQRLGAKPLINARGETVAEKPTFRNAFKRRRCLIPADGFYEWKKQGEGKQPYGISCGEVFAFAGVWETAIGPDGGEADTAAIITVASGADLKSLYPREPVVIAKERYADWLGADERDGALVAEMLRPAPAETWRAVAVSKAVGSPRSDGPQLLTPIET